MRTDRRKAGAAIVALAGLLVVVVVAGALTLGRPAASPGPSSSWAFASATPVAIVPPTPSPSPRPVTTPSPTPAPTPTGVKGLVRVDQLGYLPTETKIAYLMAPAEVRGAAFSVVDGSGAVVLHGTAGASAGSWNEAYGAVQPLDLTALQAPGTYHIEVSGPLAATSPPFEVGSVAALIAPRVDDAVAFFQAQRDGPDVIPGDLGRQPSHLNDASLDVFVPPAYDAPDSDTIVASALKRIGGPVDLSGGWFDAGDFIKFTHTTAYAVGLMFAADRDLGSNAPAALGDEARFGQAWLQKAWDAGSQTLYIQVGIGSGNTAGTFSGDHDLWRLPEQDDALAGTSNRYLSHRPAFRAGTPGSALPPNLAGRMTAALALAAQVDAASDPAKAQRELDLAASIFAKAKTVGVTEADVVTALPHAFYPESSWRDDLEWGAAELALAAQALGDPHATTWLRDATVWAKAYLATEAGHDTLNLYDTSALAHADLITALRAAPLPAAAVPAAAVPAAPVPAAGPTDGLALGEEPLLADMRSQLEVGVARAAADPFGAGAIYNDFDAAPHTFGLITTARLYDRLTATDRYAAFATGQRDWALGANPWGVSLMIGTGTTFPHCPQHVVANLSGSVDGTAPILRGAVVNGPNSADLFSDGLGDFFSEGVTCPAAGGDAFAAFNGHGSQFVDDVRSWQTVEPTLDFTAAALLAFAVEAR